MQHPYFPHTFQPFKIKNLVVKNRIVMPPMCGNLGGEYGQVTDNHIKYYEQRAKGGTGLIIVENSNIDYPLGSNGATQLRIDHERYIPGLTRLVDTIKKYGARACIQINHAGASTNNERTEGHGVVAPSDVSSKEGGETPRALTTEEIYEIVRKFGRAANRAQIAGFDAVEIHAGHSYLIAQFLSLTTNKREDEFGCGSLENRARFCLLVLQEVRKTVGPDFPIFIRIGADEFMKGGITLEDTFTLLEFFKPYVDLIDVSAGANYTLEKQIETMNFPEGSKVYLSDEIKKRFDLPTITVGNIRNPEFADKVLADKRADFIAIGRGLICDPNWVNKADMGEPRKIRKCISCNIMCVGNRIFSSRPIKCSLNPDIFGEDDHKHHKVTTPTNVVIIGGGPAGLEAACTAAEVGCNTFLFEKENEVGGLLHLIQRFPAKQKIHYFTEYLSERMAGLKNLVVFHGRTPTFKEIDELKPDLVVNATGSSPSLPPIKGLRELINREGSSIYTVTNLLKNIDSFSGLESKKVVIAGGGAVGMDCAEFFAGLGAKVTIVERLPQLGIDLDPLTKKYLMGVIREFDIDVLVDTTIEEVTQNKLICSRNGESTNLEFDISLMCLGFSSNSQHVEAMKEYYHGKKIEFINIGDSSRPRKIGYGVIEGRSILSSSTLLKRIGW
ncbi:NAD(P)/FAD-dependent oxidoreductase [Geobacter argillaceus]|uniref:2,4-dienoyl-CoA reductase-like NADH-dependent reductase (Old Yellow Enzyme family) n=1 Tax=Geobacter argillaceus TaxID=345631 RepID=A0A562V8F2_9BACT|nr:NAD(P)/FAD-dependent oxidoreductase [Geobacter argillaceus]TWJ14017.1 2,4-dienoyl-CoA reductase-like NADH-dependent reductase (Old Yellow Enzyme family) [Geobacter argillaceus]